MYEFQKYSSLYIYKNNDATYPAHFHTHCEIMYVLDGEVKVSVDGVDYVAKRDDAIFIAPHQIHSFKSSHLISIYVIFVELSVFSDYTERMNDSIPKSPIVHMDFPEEIEICRNVLGYMWQLYGSPNALSGKNYHRDCAPAADRVLTSRSMAKAAIAVFMDHIEWKKKQTATPDIMRRILEYCSEHYKTDISIQSVADALGVNTHTVTRIFTASFHCNFRKFINSLRIDEAAYKLVSTTDSITQIAFSTGFDTLRTFNRAFLADRGLTPSEYRRSFAFKEPEADEKEENSDEVFSQNAEQTADLTL